MLCAKWCVQCWEMFYLSLMTVMFSRESYKSKCVTRKPAGKRALISNLYLTITLFYSVV